MTDREYENSAQLKCIRKWRERKANRKYYKFTMKMHLRCAWYSFLKYIKGA